MSERPNPRFSPGEPAIVDVSGLPPGEWSRMHGWRVIVIGSIYAENDKVFAYETMPDTSIFDEGYGSDLLISENELRPLPPEESILKVVTETLPVPAQVAEDCPFF
jgi:hypothetical protein